jgi:glycosyltransferase involved in cell wall biosynthesis
MDISIVVCTYNRAASLQRVLESLAQVEVTSTLQCEAIVVDNNSTDYTKAVVDGFSASRLPIRYVFESTQGLATARNTGVKEARGDIIAFLDDDVVVSPQWLLELQCAFAQYPAACVGGRVPLQSDLVQPPWWRKEYDPALGQCDKGEHIIQLTSTTPGTVGIGANLSFRRSCFERYGLFRTDLGRIGASILMGEDIEFCDRLRHHGEMLVYYPRAVVYQHPDVCRMTRRYILRWFFRIGEWAFLQDVASSLNGRSTTIFGVPRWRYRVAAASLGRACWFYATAQPQQGFYELVQVVTFLGYWFGTIKSAVAPADPARGGSR